MLSFCSVLIFNNMKNTINGNGYAFGVAKADFIRPTTVRLITFFQFSVLPQIILKISYITRFEMGKGNGYCQFVPFVKYYYLIITVTENLLAGVPFNSLE